MKRYEKLAAEITQLIHSGVLVHGEKAPSIRQASRTYSVSPSTVFQAYYLLESRGLLRAKERSGYFVCNHSAQRLDEPQITQQHIESHEVGVSEL
ncbi:MAG TPA: GntR family transcriptional regulator, partial [Pseudomonas sp.]|nr:GntR family transcriptional regulator [Pseudomonas sp.]